MKFEFLWDEEKTRKLLKATQVTIFTGCLAGVIYALSIPQEVIIYRGLIVLVISALGIYGLISYILVNKFNPWIHLLVSFILTQLVISIFLIGTGGFRSVGQFGSFSIVMLVGFMLGPASLLIVSSFAVLNFILIAIYMRLMLLGPTIVQDGFLYIAVYLSTVFMLFKIGKDISLQFEARKKLEQVDDLKNQFIALASHYLRTPISIIKDSTSRIEGASVSTQNSKYLQDITDNIIKLDTLIEKFLVITSIERGKASISKLPSDINLLIGSLTDQFRNLATQQGIMLTFRSNDTIPRFPFDSIKMKVALSNIIDNAIKYNKPSGNVAISTWMNYIFCFIQIADTGSGFNKEKLSFAFEAFNRGGMDKTLNFDKPGLGLSLYISKLIIEAHGGEITVNSEEGIGTTIIIKLPMR